MIDSYRVVVVVTQEVQVDWIHAPTKEIAESDFKAKKLEYSMKANQMGHSGRIELREPSGSTADTGGWIFG